MKFKQMPLLPFILLTVSSPGFAITTPATELRHLGLDFVAYSVIADDMDADGGAEIIAGSFDHNIYVTDSEGRILWIYDVGGLPSALATGDVNGDGKKDILAVVQDGPGSVMALEYKRGVLWTYTDNQPFLSIAAGDLEGDGKTDIAVGSFLGTLYLLNGDHGNMKMKRGFSSEALICALAFGDLDGRPGEELLVGTSRKGLFALNGKGEVLWKVKAKSVGNRKKRSKIKRKERHPRYRMENIQSILVADLKGDGTKEVIIGSPPSGLVTVLSARGKQIWQRNFPDIMNTTSSAYVCVGNLIGDSRNELFCLLNGVVLSGRKATSPIILLDADGDTVGIYSPESAFFSASRGPVGKRGFQSVVLSSSVRGHGVNLVSFEEGKGHDSLSTYRDASHIKIEPYLQRIKSAKDKAPRAETRKRFRFLYRCNYRHIYGRKDSGLEEFLRPIRNAPGDNAIVVTDLYERLSKQISGGKVKQFVESEKVLEIAAWFEKSSIPFFLNVGKHATLYFSLDTLGKVLQTASRSCQGFIVDENSYTRTNLWVRFLRDIERMLSMLAKHPGKKLIMNEYLGFWHRFPLDRDIYEKLFKPQYRDVLVPIYKPNNMKSPELNLGVLVGLWKAGAINEWGVGMYGDMWKWASVFIGTPGDVELRLLLEGISLGANYFVFARNVSRDSRDVLDLSPGYKTYIGAIYDLIAKGVVAPIESPDQLMVSPMALQELPTPNELAKRALGTQVYWQEIYRWRGLLDTGFILQTTRENYLPKYYYEMINYYDGLFPRNPYGYVLIFPQTIDPSKVRGIQDYYVINEDGRLYSRHDKALKHLQSPAAISKTIKEYRARLPVSTPDAFVSAHRIAEGYLIYLINPFVFETRDVKARLALHMGDAGVKVSDAITGETLTLTNGSLDINIPAGLFRIIEIEDD